MAKIGRPGLPSDWREQVWELWKTGASISESAPGIYGAPRLHGDLTMERHPRCWKKPF